MSNWKTLRNHTYCTSYKCPGKYTCSSAIFANWCRRLYFCQLFHKTAGMYEGQSGDCMIWYSRQVTSPITTKELHNPWSCKWSIQTFQKHHCHSEPISLHNFRSFQIACDHQTTAYCSRSFPPMVYPQEHISCTNLRFPLTVRAANVSMAIIQVLP